MACWWSCWAGHGEGRCCWGFAICWRGMRAWGGLGMEMLVAVVEEELAAWPGWGSVLVCAGPGLGGAAIGGCGWMWEEIGLVFRLLIMVWLELDYIGWV